MSIITKRIESEYPTMSAKLLNKYPNLSDTQIRYCLLTKMNLSIKETATILNVTPDTVKVARSRLKKRLDIPSEMSIKMFLDKLSKE
ncbi:helix-turn-helix transcriptional regulator [Winogradskyella sp. PC D3.3]